MSPLRWMQSTAPHWTVMLEDVSSRVLTEVGGADGAGEQEMMSPGFPSCQSVLTCFKSHSSDRVTDCTPSCIGCIHSDGVATVLLQSCYDVASRAISDGGTALILIRTLS